MNAANGSTKAATTAMRLDDLLSQPMYERMLSQGVASLSDSRNQTPEEKRRSLQEVELIHKGLGILSDAIANPKALGYKDHIVMLEDQIKRPDSALNQAADFVVNNVSPPGIMYHSAEALAKRGLPKSVNQVAETIMDLFNMMPPGMPESMIAKFAAGGALAQIVLHGSPTRGIKKFSSDYIGTGEGNQAFGHGLYFTNREGIANDYRNRLGIPQIQSSAKVSMMEQAAIDEINKSLLDNPNVGWSNLDDIREHFKSLAGKEPSRVTCKMTKENQERVLIEKQKAQNVVDVIERRKNDLTLNKGQTYKVDIPEDTDLLHWDKPLSEQPEKIKKALEEAGIDIQNKPYQNVTGRDFYQDLEQQFANKERMTDAEAGQKASKYLQSLGIPGHKYPAGSIAGGSKPKIDWGSLNPPSKAIKDQIISQFKQAHATREYEYRDITVDDVISRLRADEKSNYIKEGWSKDSTKEMNDLYKQSADWLEKNKDKIKIDYPYNFVIYDDSSIINTEGKQIMMHASPKMGLTDYDPSFAKTGTGGQVQGHGLYGSTAEEVNKYYRDLFTKHDVDIKIPGMENISKEEAPILDKVKTKLIDMFKKEKKAIPINDIVNHYMSNLKVSLRFPKIPNLTEVEKTAYLGKYHTGMGGLKDQIRKELNKDIRKKGLSNSDELPGIENAMSIYDRVYDNIASKKSKYEGQYNKILDEIEKNKHIIELDSQKLSQPISRHLNDFDEKANRKSAKIRQRIYSVFNEFYPDGYWNQNDLWEFFPNDPELLQQEVETAFMSKSNSLNDELQFLGKYRSNFENEFKSDIQGAQELAFIQKYKSQLSKYVAEYQKVTGGNYKVYVPQDENLMHFEKSLAEQPKKIQEILKKNGIEIDANMTAEQLYWKLGGRSKKQGNGGVIAAKKLVEMGIPGHRYPTNYSAGKRAHSDKYNYVIYDPKDAEFANYSGRYYKRDFGKKKED